MGTDDVLPIRNGIRDIPGSGRSSGPDGAAIREGALNSGGERFGIEARRVDAISEPADRIGSLGDGDVVDEVSHGVASP